MKIIVKCEDCGRDMGTSIIQKPEVVIQVHGCKCGGAGFREGFEVGRKHAAEVFKVTDKEEQGNGKEASIT